MESLNLLLRIAYMSQGGQTCSFTTMAKELECSVPELAKAVKPLVEKGLVKVVGQGLVINPIGVKSLPPYISWALSKPSKQGLITESESDQELESLPVASQVDYILSLFLKHPKESCRRPSRQSLKVVKKSIEESIYRFESASELASQVRLYLSYYPHLQDDHKLYAPGPLGFFDTESGNPIGVATTRASYLEMVDPSSPLGSLLEGKRSKAGMRIKAQEELRKSNQSILWFQKYWSELRVALKGNNGWCAAMVQTARLLMAKNAVDSPGSQLDSVWELMTPWAEAGVGLEELLVEEGLWDTPEDPARVLELLKRLPSEGEVLDSFWRVYPDRDPLQIWPESLTGSKPVL